MALKGKKQSPEHIAKRAKAVSVALKGRKQPNEVIEKRKKKLKEMKHWVGKKHTEQSKKKMSQSALGKHNGIKAWNWKGGKDTEKQRASFCQQQREFKKRCNGGSHTFGEWETLKEQYNFTCPSCKKSEPEIILTEDHIIPISKGGSNNIENIQPLCKLCNCRKHTKIIKFDRNPLD